MRNRVKRVVVAISIALAAYAVPLASQTAHAFCGPDTGVGSGCSPCPKPIVVKGKEILRFDCLM